MKTVYILLNGKLRSLKPGVDKIAAISRLRDKGHSVMECKKPPTVSTLQKWSDDGTAKATDGCKVEPDGTCSHGHKSWLLVLGYI